MQRNLFFEQWYKITVGHLTRKHDMRRLVRRQWRYLYGTAKFDLNRNKLMWNAHLSSSVSITIHLPIGPVMLTPLSKTLWSMSNGSVKLGNESCSINWNQIVLIEMLSFNSSSAIFYTRNQSNFNWKLGEKSKTLLDTRPRRPRQIFLDSECSKKFIVFTMTFSFFFFFSLSVDTFSGSRIIYSDIHVWDLKR